MTSRTPHRLVAIALLASVSLAALAPAAQAGHGRGGPHKYRKGDNGPRYVERDYGYSPRRVVEVHRHSHGGGSTLGGFVGGLALGVILSNAQQSYASPPPAYCPPRRSSSSCDDYGYEDPYCHERFSSLDVYLVHARHYDHPRVVRVIDVRDGDCVRVIHYDHGQWGDWHDSNWDEDED